MTWTIPISRLGNSFSSSTFTTEKWRKIIECKVNKSTGTCQTSISVRTRSEVSPNCKILNQDSLDWKNLGMNNSKNLRGSDPDTLCEIRIIFDIFIIFYSKYEVAFLWGFGVLGF